MRYSNAALMFKDTIHGYFLKQTWVSKGHWSNNKSMFGANYSKITIASYCNSKSWYVYKQSLTIIPSIPSNQKQRHQLQLLGLQMCIATTPAATTCPAHVNSSDTGCNYLDCPCSWQRHRLQLLRLPRWITTTSATSTCTAHVKSSNTGCNYLNWHRLQLQQRHRQQLLGLQMFIAATPTATIEKEHPTFCIHCSYVNNGRNSLCFTDLC